MRELSKLQMSEAEAILPNALESPFNEKKVSII